MSDPTPSADEPARPKQRGGSPKASDEQIRAELDAAGFDPVEPLRYTNAHTGIPCVCRECEEEVAVIMVVVRRGGGCRICWERRKGQALRLTPAQAAERLAAANLKPLEEFTLTEVPILCKCLGCGKIAPKKVSNLMPGVGGCRDCGDKKRGPRRRSNPTGVEAMMLAADLRPLTMDNFTRLDEPLECECMKCGATVTPKPSQIKQGHGGCLDCGHEATKAGQRLDEETVRRHLDEADLDPVEPLKYVNQTVGIPCKCRNCEEIVYPQMKTLRRGDGGCRGCSFKKTAAAKIKITPDVALAELRKADLTPVPPFAYSGGRVPVKCICDICLVPTAPTIENLRAGQSGCRTCASRRNRDLAIARWEQQGLMQGYIYLVRAPANVYGQPVRKYGVTMNLQSRLRAHEAAGFSERVEIIEIMGLKACYDIETTISRHLRMVGAQPALPVSAMPRGGYTETFWESEAPGLTLAAFVAKWMEENGGGAARGGVSPVQLTLWAA